MAFDHRRAPAGKRHDQRHVVGLTHLDRHRRVGTGNKPQAVHRHRDRPLPKLPAAADRLIPPHGPMRDLLAGQQAIHVAAGRSNRFAKRESRKDGRHEAQKN